MSMSPQEWRAIMAELDRARAAEAALLAEREGMTGTPTHYGLYWCTYGPGVPGEPMHYCHPDYGNGLDGKGAGWVDCYMGGRGRRENAPLRFHRLPGVTYTPTGIAP